MKILEVTERSGIDIPILDILDKGGNLRIRPDFIGKGLVEIRQEKSVLKLRVNSIVGRLPVTDRALRPRQRRTHSGRYGEAGKPL